MDEPVDENAMVSMEISPDRKSVTFKFGREITDQEWADLQADMNEELDS